MDAGSLEQVECFKYLGLLLSCDMKWSKAKAILYRRFYGSISYRQLTDPALSPPCPFPHGLCQSSMGSLHRDQSHLEDVQNFACRMSTRLWNSSYQELLELTNMPSLATCSADYTSSWAHQILHS